MPETLVFQLDGENLSLLKEIHFKYINSGLMYGWKANNEKTYDQGHWNRVILNNSCVLPFDHFRMPFINSHSHIKTLWTTIKNLIGERSLLRVYINAYTYGTDGYAHRDDIWIPKNFGPDALSETVIVYLNEKWDIDWAGETVIFDDNDEIEKSVLPKYGRVLSFNSNKLHAARPLSRACSSLRSVLVFKTIDPKINSTAVEYVFERTKNSKHGNKSFFEHLFNTMLILERYTKDKNVLLGGLFHAVYGTEYYNVESPLDREEVKNIIGTYAESLAYEFCIIQNRFDILIENKNNYSEEFRKHLLLIELANLLDQNHSDKHQSKINQIKAICLNDVKNNK
jgi:hypothetical protein